MVKKEAQGSIARLSDQLATYKQVQQHVQHHVIDELQFYPEHDRRVETPAYKKAHDHMVHVLKLPCLVCGVSVDTLKDPAINKYGARQLETHHHVIEWALAEAIDVDKFNQRLLPHLAHRHPKDPVWAYETLFDKQKILDWVDHSEHNLWVLCDVHHRAKYAGIHEITYPTWAPMDLFRPDFEAWANSEIQKLKTS
ncbi:hypothetical protein [Uliginosibacterium gangwonense]|uniref:hypothetical protein n=1 Tax=Uliginosibacterium gangwonense TaxID=392736 RepID=UPI00036DF36D|nr:hypothetical protein [Uliginosibacterium gangwonense]